MGPSVLSGGGDTNDENIRLNSENDKSPMQIKMLNPRTENEWNNNSELKQYTGSNQDIMHELDKFKKQVIEITGRQEELGSDSHALNSALRAAIDTEEEVYTKLEDQDDK